MAYLIDANCFIEPKNTYYTFDICPGFWDWLDEQNRVSNVYSIDKVREELMSGNDELARWAKARPHFFLPIDADTLTYVREIGAWLTSSKIYKTHVIERFMSGADPFLIAYGLAHGHTLVTHETFNENERRNIKIPAVCERFQIRYLKIFDLLRITGARLVLSR